MLCVGAVVVSTLADSVHRGGVRTVIQGNILILIHLDRGFMAVCERSTLWLGGSLSAQ